MCPNFQLHHIWQMLLDLIYYWSSGKLSTYLSGQKVKSLCPLFLEALYSAGGRWVPEPLKYGLWAFKLGIKVEGSLYKNLNLSDLYSVWSVFLAQSTEPRYSILHICPVGKKIFSHWLCSNSWMSFPDFLIEEIQLDISMWLKSCWKHFLSS